MITPFRFKNKDGKLAWGMAAGARGSHAKFSSADKKTLQDTGFQVMDGDEVAFPISSYEPIQASEAANWVKYHQ